MSNTPITQNDVVAVAPELLGSTPRALNPQTWVEILTYVNGMDMTALPTQESAQTDRLARMFLAAHMLRLNQLGDSLATGPVVSESLGGERRAYGMLPSLSTLSSLQTTRYGQMYVEITGMSLAALPMVI